MSKKFFGLIVTPTVIFGLASQANAHAGVATCSTVSNDFSIPATYHWIGSNGKEIGSVEVGAAPSSDKPVAIAATPPNDTRQYYITWGDGFKFPPGTELLPIFCGDFQTTTSLAPTTTTTTTTAVGATTTRPDTPPTVNAPTTADIGINEEISSSSTNFVTTVNTLPRTGKNIVTNIFWAGILAGLGVVLIMVGRRHDVVDM